MDSLPAVLEANLRGEPGCPVAGYLLACHKLDRGQVATAVRHLMTVYHQEPDLQSAALLVFTGLNWIARPTEALLAVLLDTWEEFGRPAFDRTAKERALLDAFAEPEPAAADLPSLAGRLWRLPIQSLRAQVRQAVSSPEAAGYPALTALA